MLTLHDLIYYRHRTPPTEFAWWVRVGWRLLYASYAPQRLLLNRADEIATVSETVAGEIAEHRLTRRPVTVVPNAADGDAADRRGRPGPAGALARLHGRVHRVQGRADGRARGRAAARLDPPPREPDR